MRSLGQIFNGIPGLNQVRESEGLLWVEPERSVMLCFYRLQLDQFQGYPNARTGWAVSPGSWPGEPYWIGDWSRAGYAVLLDLDTASHGPPYRIFLAADPFYVAQLAGAHNDPLLFAIVDSDPEIAATASRQLGYSDAAGYGLVGEPRTPGLPAFPAAPNLPAAPALPALPSIPIPSGGFAPQPAAEPPAATATTAEAAARAPSWLVPAIAGCAAVAVLWFLRYTGRL